MEERNCEEGIGTEALSQEEGVETEGGAAEGSAYPAGEAEKQDLPPRPEGAGMVDSGQGNPQAYQRQPLKETRSRFQEGPTGPRGGGINWGTGQQAIAEGAWAWLERDLQEVGRIDPAIRGLEDLARRPEYPRLCGLVKKGLSLPEAYKLTYFDSLSQRAAESTRQAALNAVHGKQHLSRTCVRGSGAAPVPPDVAAEYRMLLPDATDAEIQRHYNEYSKTHRE